MFSTSAHSTMKFSNASFMPGTLATLLAVLPPLASLSTPDFSFLPDDSSDLPDDSTLALPNLSLVPPNMLTTSWRRALASSPMAMNSARLKGVEGMAVDPSSDVLRPVTLRPCFSALRQMHARLQQSEPAPFPAALSGEISR